jgi:two-component SAPR family response regulator
VDVPRLGTPPPKWVHHPAILRSNVRIDLLITDVGLPNINGRQLADAARVMRPSLKVLFVTGDAEYAVVRHGHRELGMHVMIKPFQLAAFGTRVGEILSGPKASTTPGQW